MKHAVVSYIPALHRGYLDFFAKYPGKLYVLGADFIKQAPRLERDIRALTPEEVKRLITSLSLFSSVTILDEKNIKEFLTASLPIVMPEDEVNRQFSEKYLGSREITFVPTFLRWNRTISTTEFEVPPDRVISENEFDKKIIADAFEESKKSSDWWRQIGAILMRDKKIMLTSHNTPMPADNTPNIFGDPRSNFDAQDAQYKELGKFIHGEANIIAEAAKKGISTEGTVLYTTTFPCPACAKLIAVAGIKEVYYAKGYSMLDAEDILRSFNVKLIMVK